MAELKKTLGGVQYFSIGFGTIVGVGWIVYLGFWFEQAGPVGTAIAFLLGAALMAVIGLCYAELATMFPVAGAEAAYGFAAFGSGAAFAVGWAIVLMLIAVIPYVSVSLAWILEFLIPGIGGPTLYEWRGQPIKAGGLAIAIGWTLWLGFINYRGIKGAARFQDWLTYGKIAISAVFFAAGIFGGSVENLEPMLGTAPNGTTLAGIIAVLATTPWFLAGFNQIPQLLEEKAHGTAVRSVGLIVVGSIIAGGIYYALAALSAGMAGPWQQVSQHELPAAAAFRLAFGSEFFARFVLVSGLFGIVTVGNACSIACSRLLFSLSRARCLGPTFLRLHATYGSPVPAIVFATIFSAAGTLLGRGGIAPIVNVGSAAACFGYLVAAVSLISLRRTDPDRPRPYRVPGGVATAGAAAVFSLLLLYSAVRQNWIDAGGRFPMEWGVMLIWASIGVALYRLTAPRREQVPADERRRVMIGDAQA